MALVNLPRCTRSARAANRARESPVRDVPRFTDLLLCFLPSSERLLAKPSRRFPCSNWSWSRFGKSVFPLFHLSVPSRARPLLSLLLLAAAAAAIAGKPPAEEADGRADFLENLLVAFNSDSNSSSRNGDVQAYYSSSAVPIASVSSASPGAGGGGGVCDCCGATLKVVGLDPPARERVRSALIRLGAETANRMPPLPPPQPRTRQSSRLDSAFAAGEDHARNMQGGEQAQGGAMGDLEQFADWLEERRREVSLRECVRLPPPPPCCGLSGPATWGGFACVSLLCCRICGPVLEFLISWLRPVLLLYFCLCFVRVVPKFHVTRHCHCCFTTSAWSHS